MVTIEPRAGTLEMHMKYVVCVCGAPERLCAGLSPETAHVTSIYQDAFSLC